MLLERIEHKDKDGSEGFIECIYDSSNILRSTYFPKEKRMYVSFNKGIVYSYGNISKTLYEDFEKADSQGKFFIEQIKKKPEEYPYRKEFTLYPTEIKIINEKKEQLKKENEEDDE